MATSVTQFGITITFSTDHTIGQYVNGDYYVVGPISVIQITVDSGNRIAGSTVGQDGATINPPTLNTQGFDSRQVQTYSASLNETLSFPFTVSAGESLVASESYPTPVNIGGTHIVYLKTAIVLTCVSTPPAANTFRPAYSGGDTTVRLWSDIDKASRLPLSLTPPPSVPELSVVEGYVSRLFLDVLNSVYTREIIPHLNSPDYGREIAINYGTALLMLLLDENVIGNKDTLIKGIVQVGIDIYMAIINGKNYYPNGGHYQGRAGIVLITGYLLQDAGMMSLGGDTIFQENSQTFYISQTDVNRALLIEVSGVAQGGSATNIQLSLSTPTNNQYALDGLTITLTSGTGSGQVRVIDTYDRPTRNAIPTINFSPAPDNTTNYVISGYVESDIGRPEWGIRHGTVPTMDNPSPNATYRSTNGRYWFGQALAAAALGLVETWDHPPFWHYIDSITLPENADPDFHEEMAIAHWSTYYSPPVPIPTLSVKAVPAGLS